ncbi:MAG: hypothetical protein ACYDCO_21980 [Armatimonadota bacterium]
MRRIKAIYLVPVFLVLLIGAAVASYYFLFKPQLEKVDAARQAWEAERKACETEEGPGGKDYQAAFDEQAMYAKQIYLDHYQFQEIQKTMPAIYNMKERFAGKEKDGIYEWYRVMGEGRMIRELDRWARSFHLPNPPAFEGIYGTTMGYEETLPSSKTVSIDFTGAAGKPMMFNVRGFGNLLNSLRRVTGYRYFPMILSLPNDTATIKIGLARTDPRHNPQSPMLSMQYSATAYMMTQGWDPMGAGAEAKMAELRATALTKKTAPPHRTDWDPTLGPCPPVLFFIEQQGLQY